MLMAKILNSSTRRLSPWVALETKSVDWEDRRGTQVYHAFAQADYVSVLAITSDGYVPLLRQFRPGCGAYTIELPGGMLEPGESPESCAQRELYEETGYVGGKLTSLGSVWPDPGRLSNELHCYMMTDVVSASEEWASEDGLEVELVSYTDFLALAAKGQLNNAHHLAIVGLAFAAGLLFRE